MNNNITRRQHYISRFYLRQFALQRNNNFYIWCYDKSNGKIFNSNVRNIGLENWFYDKKFQGENVFEKALSILEGYFSGMYRIIQEKPISLLTKEEKQLIAELVYLQDIRTRKARDEFIRVNGMVVNNDDFQDYLQEDFPDRIIEDHLEDLKRIIQLSEMFNLKVNNNKPRFSDTLDRMMEFDLFLLKNDIRITGSAFYTSDHPICHYSMSEEKDMKIIFPITPELCLMFTNDNGWESMHPSHNAIINKKFVQVTNERMVEKSYRFIFSKTNNFKFVKRVLNIRNE